MWVLERSYRSACVKCTPAVGVQGHYVQFTRTLHTDSTLLPGAGYYREHVSAVPWDGTGWWHRLVLRRGLLAKVSGVERLRGFELVAGLLA